MPVGCRAGRDVASVGHWSTALVGPPSMLRRSSTAGAGRSGRPRARSPPFRDTPRANARGVSPRSRPAVLPRHTSRQSAGCVSAKSPRRPPAPHLSSEREVCLREVAPPSPRATPLIRARGVSPRSRPAVPPRHTSHQSARCVSAKSPRRPPSPHLSSEREVCPESSAISRTGNSRDRPHPTMLQKSVSPRGFHTPRAAKPPGQLLGSPSRRALLHPGAQVDG
jgi:hypothetical protein